MRKVILKFMLINVGMDWSKEAMHDEILNKIENRHNEQDSYLDLLHKTDFIHLSDVLFRKYRTLDLNALDRILINDRFSENTYEVIKKVLPKSNWERHFSNIIQYDEEKLKDKWQLLYKLRNDVAHNRYISQSDFAKIKGLVRDIKQVLHTTIDELDKIHLTEEDKENITEDKENIIMRALLSRAERREIIIQYLVEHPSHSNSWVASETGGDDKTVENYRQELENEGKIPKFDKLTGMDGVKRPRKISR